MGEGWLSLLRAMTWAKINISNNFREILENLREFPDFQKINEFQELQINSWIPKKFNDF